MHHLEKFGFELVVLPVDRYGRVDPDQLDGAINDRTILVSLMLANNEVGTIQPIGELIRRVRAHRSVVIHVDAVQAAPYMAIDVRQLDVDLLSIAAHKFEGPKGIGRAVRPARHDPAAADTWRLAGALPPCRNGERGRRRWHGVGPRSGHRRAQRGRAATRVAA